MTINLPRPFKTSDGMHTFHAQPDDRGGVWMNIDGNGPSVGLHYKDVQRLRDFLAQLPMPGSVLMIDDDGVATVDGVPLELKKGEM